MRAFFAIPMPHAQREELARAQARLSFLAGVAWVRPENFHLTLAFLGDVDEAMLGVARRALVQAPCPEGQARLTGLSAFPSLSAARVLFAGVEGGEDWLRVTARYLQLECGCRGESFVPHVTIGRVRVGAEVDALAASSVVGSLGDTAFPLSPIVLYQSRRDEKGPRYEELARKE